MKVLYKIMLAVGCIVLPLSLFAQTFEANLSGLNEVQPVSSTGSGLVTIAVDASANEIVVTGSFEALTGNYTMSHIHIGLPGTNGGVIQNLAPTLGADNRGGEFEAASNTFTLTAEQIEAMLNGQYYVNVHSVAYPSGELRGQILPEGKNAPSAVLITSPPDNFNATIEGASATPFVPSWEASSSDERVVYIWQLSASADFSALLVNVNVGTETEFAANFGAVDQILAGAGIELGGNVTVYHRAIASDGSRFSLGDAATVNLTRGEVVYSLSEVRALGAGSTATFEATVSRAFELNTRVQDGDAGIFIRQTNMSSPFRLAVRANEVRTGTRLKVRGTVSQFNNLLQIDGAALLSWEIVEQDVPVLPVTVTLKDIEEAGEQYESSLIRVENVSITSAIEAFAFSSNVAIEDGSGAAGVDLRIGNSGESRLGGLSVPEGVFTFTGILTQFSSSDPSVGYQLMPIETSDVFAPANVQVVHNAADPAAEQVDIYIDNVLTLENFAFRTATPYVALPPLREVVVGVAPAGSSSAADVIASFPFTLEPAENYIVVANGVLDPTAFAANPDEVATGFDVLVKAMAKTEAASSSNVEFFVVHGATDAPAVDVFASGVSTALVSGAPYRGITDYIAVPAAAYELDIKVAGTEVIAAAFDADLSGLGGGAAAVIASGFLDPSNNQAGAQFGLLAVLADGTTLMLPSKMAKVQVVHNAADPGAATVDIWANGAKFVDNFQFRRATPFVEVPAYLPLVVGVAGPNSETYADTLVTFTFRLDEDVNYVALANGVLNPANFAANPDEKDIAFNVFAIAPARTVAEDDAKVDLVVFHGATDAPAVDVVVDGTTTPLVANAAYGENSGYITVDPGTYTLNINVAGTSTTAATFDADLTGLAGQAITVVASGFLNAGPANQNGGAFNLIVVLADGTTLPLFNTATSNEDLGFSDVPESFVVRGNYPNPFNPSTTIAFDLPQRADVTLQVYNVLGQQIFLRNLGNLNAGANQSIVVDAQRWASGMYIYRLVARGQGQTFTATGQMTLLK